MLFKLIGVVLIFDGILSLMYVWDRAFLWQLGRMVRVGLGVILLVA